MKEYLRLPKIELRLRVPVLRMFHVEISDDDLLIRISIEMIHNSKHKFNRNSFEKCDN